MFELVVIDFVFSLSGAMPTPSPTTSSIRPVLPSVLVISPIDLRVVGALLLGLLLVVVVALLVIVGIWQ
jgi:hypothetical protein